MVVVGTGSNCAPQAEEDADCKTDTTVEAHPDIHAEKTVGDGEHETNAEPGDVLDYSITVTNSGKAAGPADVSDDVSAILAHATILATDISDGGTLTAGKITWPQFTLAANGGTKTLTFKATLNAVFPEGTTHLPNAVVVVGTGSNCLPQANEDADCHTITDVSEFLLVISKTNNAPIVVLDLPDGSHPGLPTAPEGSTVTYTLAYHVGTLDVTNGIITDVIPVGLQYTTLSATNSDEFIFQGYNATTRTLTWRAATVTKDGTVTYKALVLKDAAKLAQPLTNTATIDSDQTVPDSDTSDVFVPTVPGGETHKPTTPADRHPGPDRTERPRLQPDAPPGGPRSARRGHRVRHPGPGRRPASEPPLGFFPSRSSTLPRGRRSAGSPRLPNSCAATPSGVRPGRSTITGGVPRSFFPAGAGRRARLAPRAARRRGGAAAGGAAGGVAPWASPPRIRGRVPSAGTHVDA